MHAQQSLALDAVHLSIINIELGEHLAVPKLLCVRLGYFNEIRRRWLKNYVAWINTPSSTSQNLFL